ncbi:MAG: hypothetical protein HFJ51_05765 [Clostridia bacterium]|nr:hypothetical protein [Clostridia bacterium]
MQLQSLSAQQYTPVLLGITQFNGKEGIGRCSNAYVGFMTHERIYAKLVTSVTSKETSGLPEYIRVRKGKTSGFEQYKELKGMDLETVSVRVRDLSYDEGTSLSQKKGVNNFPADDPAAKIIETLWPAELIRKALEGTFIP